MYHVQFKRASKIFLLHPAASKNVNMGDFVVVEADRGEDLGVVFKITQQASYTDPPPTAGFRGINFFNK